MADWPTGPPTYPPAHPGLRVGGAEYPSGPPQQWPDHAPSALAPVPAYGGPPGGYGPTPPPPDDGQGRAWPVAVTAIVAVCVLALVIVGVGTLVSSSDDGPDEATDTTIDLSDPEITAPPSEEPLVPTMPSLPGIDPGGGVDPAERARPLDDVLPELIAFVEETRGQEFVSDPVVQAVPDDEFEDLLAAAQAGETEAIETSSVADVALGLLPPGFDLVGATEDLGAVSVLGFYEPESAELYVKGDQVTPFVQAVIVHELTHALDDQIFDLDRLEELDERADESAFGFLALVEGTASYVGRAFQEQLSAEDAAAYEAEQYGIGLDQLPAAMDLPPLLLVESQVPYASGQRFVEALLEEGGTAELDTAYGEPPTTSEQILDPALYLAGEAAVALTPLEAPDGVEVVDQGAFGAADLRLLELVSDPLTALIDPNLGQLEPVPDYGGGQFVSWTQGDESCISLEMVGDDAAGSTAIQDALETWSGFAPGAEVSSRVGGSGIDVITATRCA